jgi:hypothetical protein
MASLSAGTYTPPRFCAPVNAILAASLVSLRGFRMATIITVHGTGATGPEEGDEWWQKGSPFEKHLRELVESKDGLLRFQRLIWDGANSETSRRKAAGRLYEEVKKLEREGEKYSLVGHSHGGSVIVNALFLAASHANKLTNLTRVIAVGTPFIESVKSFWLFSRSGFLGKSVLVSTTASVFALGFVTLFFAFSKGRSNFLTNALFTTVFYLVPLTAVYSMLWLLNRRHYYMYRPTILRFSRTAYIPRLVSLCHKDDEAINGLKSLSNLDIQIFQRDFAVSFLALASLFLLPILLILLAMWPTMLGILVVYENQLGVVLTIPPGSSFGAHMMTVMSLIMAPVAALLDKIGIPHNFGAVVLILLGIIIVIVVTSLIVTGFVTALARYVSGGLSIVFNWLTWKQIRRMGFGNDVVGELAIKANSVSPWMNSRWLPIPETLAAKISELSDKAASTAAPKFRHLINQLALSKEKEMKSFFFSEYLTWNELIHTSYFSVPGFRMLVAYAIANSEGFRPSEAFKNHPDYSLVAGWYEEMKPKAKPVGS